MDVPWQDDITLESSALHLLSALADDDTFEKLGLKEMSDEFTPYTAGVRNNSRRYVTNTLIGYHKLYSSHSRS